VCHGGVAIVTLRACIVLHCVVLCCRELQRCAV